jgi:hypothetical protein
LHRCAEGLLWQRVSDLFDPVLEDLVVLQGALKSQLGLGMSRVEGHLEMPQEVFGLLGLGDLLVNFSHHRPP